MKVSIIVPVYNVAPYITDCLQSVINQTYTDLEVLLIDDCGTDDSIQIAERIVQEYKGSIQFRILHHDINRGLSAARNTGIDEAKGEYIFFLDSDDTIFPECIQNLYDSITQEVGIDMAIGNYDVDLKSCPPPLKLESGIYKNNILELYTHAKFYMMAWNKLIKKDFLLKNNLYFKEGIIHEDDLWSFCCACKLRKISVLQQKTLLYRVRYDGIQRGLDYEEHYLNNCEVVKCMIEYVLYNGMRDNSLVFVFIRMQLHCLILSPLYHHRPKLTKFFYQSFVKSHFWGIKEIVKFPNITFSLMFYLRRFFSLNIIYPFFIRFYLRKYDTDYVCFCNFLV